MKKFLSFVVVAVMLVTTLSVATLAAMPKASDFIANNGFFIYDTEAKAFSETRDPATVSDTANGVKVVHGGYYAKGDDFGGVTSAEKYDLNGLTVTIYFETVPEVTVDTDCWIAIDFLAAQRGFYTNNFDPANGGNNGVINLLRFGKPYTEFYGPSAWSQSYGSGSEDTTVNGMFAVKSGTTLTVKLDRTATGTYTYTYSREGFEDFVVPYEFNLQDIMPDGKGYVVVTASCKTSGEDAFTYYIKDVTNGKALTEEELAAAAEAKAAAELAKALEEATVEVQKSEEKANEAMAEAKAIGDEDAISKAQDALDAIADAYAAIEDKKPEEAIKLSDLARDYVKESGDFVKAAEKDAESKGEKADDETNNVGEPQTEEKSFPVVPVVIIVVVAAVVVAAVIVIAKKKK